MRYVTGVTTRYHAGQMVYGVHHVATGDRSDQRPHPARRVKAHAEQARCGCCQAPTKGVDTVCEECVEGRDGLRDLLGRLTSRMIGAEAPGATPLRLVVRGADAPRTHGFGRSTAWDTPRGEAANLPRILREATARQTRFAAEQGVRTKGRAEEPALAVDHRAGSHLSRLRLVVAELAIATARATGTSPQRSTWGAVARWIDVQMPAVRRMEDAPELLRRLREVSERAMKHADRPAARLYLGPCDRHLADPSTGIDLGLCPGEYRGLEGDPTACCTACRADVSVEARKRALLAEAGDRWMTASEIENLTAALGHRVAAQTVTSWARERSKNGRSWPPKIRSLRMPRRGGAGDAEHFLLADALGELEKLRAKERRSA